MPNDVTVDLGNAYIGSAYSPQVAITETETGHEIDFTFADSEHPGQTKTEGFEVPNYASEEAAREAAEAARAAAESARAAAEQARTAAESARASAETGRATAESDREDAETARAAAEQARAAAETARASAEGSRASAEQARTSAESARASAEAGRAQAESARVSAEQARATAESARASAEAARESAEATRQTNTAAAITRADAATSAANTATTNAQTATTAAQAATGEAETATDAANAAAALATAAAETITDAYFPNLTAGAAEGITGGGPTDTAAWTYRACPGTDGPATIESIHGRTVVWNQLVGSDTASVTVPSGHKYVSYIETTVDDATTTVKTLATSDGTAIATTGGTDCVFDLTQMFGAGNEPSTVAEFEALYPASYYPYDAGSLLPVNMAGIETTGLNQFDPANVRTNIFINGATGKIAGGTDTQTAVVEVFPNTDYCLTYTGGNRCIIAGVDSMAPAVGDDARVIFNTGSRVSPKVFNTGNNRYVVCFIATSAAPATDICVNISDPTRNGEYEPYWQFERTIPATDLRSAGTVYDELTSDEAIVRVGAVDLGTLTWALAVDPDIFVAAVSGMAINGTALGRLDGLTCAKYQVDTTTAISANMTDKTMKRNNGNVYIRDSTYTDATALKQAMSGVMLHYELATPTVTPIDPPLNLTYRAENGGTERIVHTDPTAAPTLVVTYGSTADGIRDRALGCIARIENGRASANYGVGSYLIHGGTLCRVTTAIAAGEAIVPGINVTATTVMAEVLSLVQ